MHKRFLRILRNSIIIALAYLHSFEPIILLALGGKWFAKSREDVLLVMGISCLLHAVHSLVGYICGWEHVYCSFSNRRKFIYTLDGEEAVEKEDVYKYSAAGGIAGVIAIAAYVYFRYFQYR